MLEESADVEGSGKRPNPLPAWNRNNSRPCRCRLGPHCSKQTTTDLLVLLSSLTTNLQFKAMEPAVRNVLSTKLTESYKLWTYHPIDVSKGLDYEDVEFGHKLRMHAGTVTLPPIILVAVTASPKGCFKREYSSRRMGASQAGSKPQLSGHGRLRSTPCHVTKLPRAVQCGTGGTGRLQRFVEGEHVSTQTASFLPFS